MEQKPYLSSQTGSSQKRVSQVPLPQQRTLDMYLSGSSAGSPAKSTIRTSMPQTPSHSRLSVALKSSPLKGPYGTPLRSVEDDVDELVASDLSSQFRRPPGATPRSVSLAHHIRPREVVVSADAPQQKRKRGRPKGWRPGLSNVKLSEAEISAARRLREKPKDGITIYTGKRRGRPPKAPSPPPREIYEKLEPHFLRFLCEWGACKAELHNAETLRKHVSVVHAHTSPFRCRWAKCEAKQPSPVFQTAENLTLHVEDVHMPPIIWQVGDGSQVHVTSYAQEDESGLPDYLFDRNGKQVTPSIRDQELEDINSWRENRRKLKELFRRRDENLASDEEDDDDVDTEMETTEVGG